MHGVGRIRLNIVYLSIIKTLIHLRYKKKKKRSAVFRNLEISKRVKAANLHHRCLTGS